MAVPTAPVRVVVSYSHSDETRRQELMTMLAPLVREGLISLWTDHKILAGKNLDVEIQSQLKRVDIVLLLISPDFIASDYCYCIEMETAIERHNNGRSVVVPIILRHADWGRTPFGRLKALPSDAKPVSTWSSPDEAWLDVARGIRDAATAWLARNPEGRESAPENPGRILPLREALKANFVSLQDRYEGEARIAGFGLAEIDDYLGGIEKGGVYLAAARPFSGLLELCLSSAVFSAIRFRRNVLFVSLRQRAEKISQRMVASVGVVDAGRLQSGLLADEDWARVNMAIKLLADAKISLIDEVGLTLNNIADHIRNASSGAPIDLLVVDGLEYLSSGGSGDEAAIARGLRSIARTFNIAVVANLTLDPDLEHRVDRRPLTSDLRAWHVFHQDADAIFFLYRDFNYSGEDRERLEIEVFSSQGGTSKRFQARYLEHVGVITDCEFHS